MMQQNRSYVLLLVFPLIFSCTPQRDNHGEDEAIYRKVDSILSLMTLQEKAGQMLNLGLSALLTGDFYETRDTLIFDTAKVTRLLVEYGAGSVQNKGNFPLSTGDWRFYIDYIRRTVLEKSRLKIPVLYGIDAVHGANYTSGSTMFPHQINLAATFNTDCAYKVGEVTAYEMKASGIPWNYAPVLDVARNPLWGRIYETFGEDSYVVSQMGSSIISGMQNGDPAAFDKVLACGKHFIGYGAPYNGKDRSPVYMTERMIRQILLPPFQKAVDNGLLSVMLASGSLNGVPSHIDKWWITDILKGELGFRGVVISDWSDIMNLVDVHRVATDEREAVKLSVLAGLDICMEPYDESFMVHLIDLVQQGEVPESRVNDAVRRILYVKYKSGIFKAPLFTSHTYDKFASEEYCKTNLEIAGESITLLKNEDDILPLPDNLKVLVTGVSSNSLNYLNGGWSRTWDGGNPAYNDEKLTILEAIEEEVGKNNVLYTKGTEYLDEVDINDAVKKAYQADVIIACIGEKPATEKPSDIEELDLPETQVELIKELAKAQRPIVLVMVQGRPRIIRKIEPLTHAVVMAYLPGNEGGKAVSDVLFGNINPSGKLPYTYPRYSGSVWTYDHQTSDERDVTFGLKGFTPQYEFGYGLSYTSFMYDTVIISENTISPVDTVQVKIKVTNTGKRKGKEAVLLYYTDEVATIAPNVKQLVRFKKIELVPGQSQIVEFSLSVNDLMFVDEENRWIAEKGYFTLHAGNKQARFYLNEDFVQH